MADLPGRVIILRNRTSFARIEPQYRPIVDAAVEFCSSALGDELLEIRVLGSVARGDAIPGVSDIDVAAITTTEIEPGRRAAIDEWAIAASKHYPQVFAVDVDLYARSEITSIAALRLIMRPIPSRCMETHSSNRSTEPSPRMSWRDCRMSQWVESREATRLFLSSSLG